MQVEEGIPEPALGWLLSAESENMIGAMMENVAHNKRAVEIVLTAIGASKKTD